MPISVRMIVSIADAAAPRSDSKPLNRVSALITQTVFVSVPARVAITSDTIFGHFVFERSINTTPGTEKSDEKNKEYRA